MPLEHSSRNKKHIPEGVWTKCNKCEQIIYNKELEENFKICPKCGAHFRLKPNPKWTGNSTSCCASFTKLSRGRG